VVEIRDRQVGLFEAVAEGRTRDRRIVLAPAEALLLRRGNELAVLEKAGGGVVEVRRDADDVQAADARGWERPVSGGFLDPRRPPGG